MASIGYTLMTEQAGPKQLVADAAASERAGFDFEVMSDHFSPWLTEQGHAPYAWSVLGAVAHVTERVELMTYVTCPTVRYHPAVIAQAAATIGMLSDNRFTLGLGSGENLNEHILTQGWPPANVRQEMLDEAIAIINALFDGGYVNYSGQHFRVDSAKVWDLPAVRVPLAAAVSGPQSVQRYAGAVDHLIAVEPQPDLVSGWDAVKQGPSRKIAQLPISWGRDRDAAITRAHQQFRWFAGGWKVNAELPGPSAFAAATAFVRESDVAESIPCGPDIEPIVKAFGQFWDAGFTDVCLVQIGGDEQGEFLRFAESELLPALRETGPVDR